MKRGLALAFSIVAILAAVQALAQSQTERSFVEIVAVGDNDNAISPSLSELLHRVDLSLRPADPEAAISPSALARVTIDLRDGEPNVVILDRTGAVVAKRTFHATSRKVAFEELALFVRFTLDGLVEQERALSHVDGGIALPEEDAAPAAVLDAAPTPMPEHDARAPRIDSPKTQTAIDPIVASKPTRVAFDLGVAGAVQAFSPEVPVLGGLGAMASVEFGRGRFRPALALSGTYFARGSTRRDNVDVHVGLVSFRLMPSFALYDGSWLSIDASVGGGIDIVTVDTHTERFGAVAHDVSGVVPVGTMALTGKLALGARATFFFELMGDADLSPRSYVVFVDGNADPAVRPFPIRVSALMGVAIRLAGER